MGAFSGEAGPTALVTTHESLVVTVTGLDIMTAHCHDLVVTWGTVIWESAAGVEPYWRKASARFRAPQTGRRQRRCSTRCAVTERLGFRWNSG